MTTDVINENFKNEVNTSVEPEEKDPSVLDSTRKTESDRYGDENEEIRSIFDRVQRTRGSVKRFLFLARKSCKKEPNAFRKEFFSCLKCLLPHFKKEICVQRTLQFLSNLFVIQEWHGNEKLGRELSVATLEEFLQFITAKDKGVRLRTIQILAIVLRGLGNECEELTDELWDSLEAKLLKRLDDRIPAIRCATVDALERMQNVGNSEENQACPVIKSFSRLLAGDSSAEVRKTVLRAIHINESTLPLILNRVRDLKEDVRVQALKQLQFRVKMQDLASSERIFVLRHGLSDRCTKVVDACIEMLSENWFASVDYNPISFLSFLQVEAHEETCEKALRALFAASNEFDRMKDRREPFPIALISTYLNKDDEFKKTIMSPEGSFLLRIQCQIVKSEDMDDIIPDISSFCEQIEQVASINTIDDETKQMSHLFVLKQFLLIAPLIDSSHDEVGKERIKQLIPKLLLAETLNEEIVSYAIPLYRSAYVNEEEFFKASLQILQQLMEKLPKTISERFEINSISSEEKKLQSGIQQMDLPKKLGSDRTCNEEKENPVENWKIQRGLNVLSKVLGIVNDIWDEDSKIEALIFSLLQSKQTELRRISCECLGLYSLLSKAQAKRSLPILLRIAQQEIEQITIRATALKGIFDLIMVYGAENLVADVMNGETHASDELLYTLLSMLDNAEEMVRLVCAEGFARASYLNRVHDVGVLQCLLVLLFHPSTEHDYSLRQCLSVFFPNFSSRGGRNQDLILEVVPTILSALLRPPLDSPLEDISAVQVLEYLLYLLAESTAEVKNAAIVHILCEIAADPANPRIRGLIKCLRSVQCEYDESLLAIADAEWENIAANIQDNISIHSFTRWVKSLPLEKEFSNDKAVDDFRSLVKDRVEEVQESLHVDKAKVRARRGLRSSDGYETSSDGSCEEKVTFSE